MKSFSGTINEDGFASRIEYPGHPDGPRWARPLRLYDLETNRYRILLRFIWRRRPFYFALIPFFRAERGTRILRLGRKLEA